jgi:hypothetical protein
VRNGTNWQVKHNREVLSAHYTKQAAVTAGQRVAKANTRASWW